MCTWYTRELRSLVSIISHYLTCVVYLYSEILSWLTSDDSQQKKGLTVLTFFSHVSIHFTAEFRPKNKMLNEMIVPCFFSSQVSGGLRDIGVFMGGGIVSTWNSVGYRNPAYVNPRISVSYRNPGYVNHSQSVLAHSSDFQTTTR